MIVVRGGEGKEEVQKYNKEFGGRLVPRTAGKAPIG
jgi:hypothetical protein